MRSADMRQLTPAGPKISFLMILSGCDHIAISLFREVLADEEHESFCERQRDQK